MICNTLKILLEILLKLPFENMLKILLRIWLNYLWKYGRFFQQLLVHELGSACSRHPYIGDLEHQSDKLVPLAHSVNYQTGCFLQLQFSSSEPERRLLVQSLTCSLLKRRPGGIFTWRRYEVTIILSQYVNLWSLQYVISHVSPNLVNPSMFSNSPRETS